MMNYGSDPIAPIAPIGVLLAFALGAATALPAQTPSVEKVEPPNWWAGHSINPVRGAAGSVDAVVVPEKSLLPAALVAWMRYWYVVPSTTLLSL